MSLCTSVTEGEVARAKNLLKTNMLLHLDGRCGRGVDKHTHHKIRIINFTVVYLPSLRLHPHMWGHRAADAVLQSQDPSARTGGQNRRKMILVQFSNILTSTWEKRGQFRVVWTSINNNKFPIGPHYKLFSLTLNYKHDFGATMLKLFQYVLGNIHITALLPSLFRPSMPRPSRMCAPGTSSTRLPPLQQLVSRTLSELV